MFARTYRYAGSHQALEPAFGGPKVTLQRIARAVSQRTLVPASVGLHRGRFYQEKVPAKIPQKGFSKHRSCL